MMSSLLMLFMFQTFITSTAQATSVSTIPVCAGLIPVRYPVICLSKLLNCCLYFSLEAWGTAQSLGPPVSMGDISDGEEEAELQGKHEKSHEQTRNC